MKCALLAGHYFMSPEEACISAGTRALATHHIFSFLSRSWNRNRAFYYTAIIFCLQVEGDILMVY